MRWSRRSPSARQCAGRAGRCRWAGSGSAVTGLLVLGERVAAAPNRRFRLGGWGTLTTLEQQGAVRGTTAAGPHAFVVALDLVLRAAHAGLPAGTEIEVGYAEARGVARSLPPPPGGHTGVRAPTVTPPLGDRGDVFPVARPPAWGDTFGGLRGDEPGGWHHGDDLFAPRGDAGRRVCRRHGLLASAGRSSAGAASGSATRAGTSSTTRTSPGTRRSRSTAPR